MRVFKFGGASVKDADSVKNVGQILSMFRKEKIIVVISAMGKMTNALEKVVQAYVSKSDELPSLIEEVKTFHTKIIDDLGFAPNHDLRGEVQNSFTEIDWIIEEEPTRPYGFYYDQIVSHGELISTRILSAYLNENKIENSWLDIRDVLQTDNNYREAKVNYDLTGKLIAERIPVLFEK